MIKKFLEMLYSGPNPVHSPREFNEEMLEGHREYVYAMLHQQVRGLS
jgi:Icc-related predicted phosphoesterase